MYVIYCSIDCVGILKLRNSDVEARIGIAKSKKKSTHARMVFRVNIPRPNGKTMTLQTSSTSISCSKYPIFLFVSFYIIYDYKLLGVMIYNRL